MEYSRSAKYRLARDTPRTFRPFPWPRRYRRHCPKHSRVRLRQCNTTRPAQIESGSSAFPSSCYRTQERQAFSTLLLVVADAINRAGPVVGNQYRTVLGQHDIGRAAEIALVTFEPA